MKINQPLHNIPTNVITGFLGVGKTTAILHLLKNKPQAERWSVLVNEAGKIGVDGKVMQNAGITVKQVPGGCMCCASGLPMQVAVNQLLLESRPQRLLIEPSGMGHPANIMKTLMAREYQGVLDLRACLCLIDPRHLSDPRYLDSELFIDQIKAADVLIANKTDQCLPEDHQRFDRFVSSMQQSIQQTAWISHGDIQPEWLELEHQTNKSKFSPVDKVAGSIFEHFSIAFADDIQFNLALLLGLVQELNSERLKAIVNTDKGVKLINSVNGDTEVSPFSIAGDYRLEIISTKVLDQDLLKSRLGECQVSSSAWKGST